AVYGSHPYGRHTEGDTSSLRRVTRDEIRRFQAARYVPSAAAIVVVGDSNAAMLLPQLESAFGSWTAPAGGSALPRPPPPARQVKGRRVVLVDKPGAAQTQIWIARVGPSRPKAD